MMILNELIHVREIKTKADKAYCLDELAKQGHKELLTMIFDKDVRFFVDIDKVKTMLSDTLDITTKTDDELNQELLNLLKLLASQQIRGTEGNIAVARYINQLYENEQIEMLYDILDNKPRLLIGPTDINKLCKEFKIEQFEVMFALQWDKCKPDWRKQYYIQPKIDGMRTIGICKEGIIDFFTRTGEPITSLNKIKTEIEDRIIGSNFVNFVLDGECVNGTLEETGSIRRINEQVDSAVYTLFGIYPLDEWDTKDHTQKYFEVLSDLYNFSELFTSSQNIHRIDYFEINATSEEEFHERIQKFTSEFIDQGYEGAVLKTIDHVYQPSAGTRRSKDWIKIKPKLKSINHCVKDSDGIIVDILEGEGSHQGMVGKFVVKWLSDTFEVAPGKMNHKMRKEVWENKENYIGEKLEFQFQLLSKYNIPRHAFFTKFRDD